MKTMNATRFACGLLGLAIAGVVSAQSSVPADFPAERTKPMTCADFGWNDEMEREHPRVIDTCQEVVTAAGISWARLEARFVDVQSDGLIRFSIRDKHDRVIEEVTMEPAPGQVAYIDDRPTPFDQLEPTDTINLYVAEGDYGFSTRPGVATERFTRYETYTTSTPPPVTGIDETEVTTTQQDQLAMNDTYSEPMPTRLPDTAGVMPWLAVAGSLLLFFALSLRLFRKR